MPRLSLRRAPALRLAWGFAAIPSLLLLAALHAHGQQPEPVRDTMPLDTVGRDTLGVDSIPADTLPQNIHGLQGFLYAIVLAPSLIMGLDLYEGPPRDTLGYGRNHVQFSLSGGYSTSGGTGLAGMEGWFWSRNVELLVGRFYAEGRFQQHDYSERLLVRAARFGYIARDGRKLAGGVTLGYREGREDLARRGPEIAFPLVWGSRHRWARWEVGYLLGTHHASYLYRLRGEWLLPRTPFYAGFDFEGSVPLGKSDSLTTGAFGIVVGVRR